MFCRVPQAPSILKNMLELWKTKDKRRERMKRKRKSGEEKAEEKEDEEEKKEKGGLQFSFYQLAFALPKGGLSFYS